MWTNTWESNDCLQEGKGGEVPALACNHLALGEIVLLSFEWEHMAPGLTLMWGVFVVWRRRNVLWCANFVWRQTVQKCENIHGALFPWHSHCMSTLSDLSILLLMDIWVMSYYEIAGVFMYSGYKLFVRHICCKYFSSSSWNLLILKWCLQEQKFEILLV